MPIQLQSVQKSWISRSDIKITVCLRRHSAFFPVECQLSELATGIYCSMEIWASQWPVVCSQAVPEVINGRNEDLVVLPSVCLSTFSWLNGAGFHSHWQICVCSPDAIFGHNKIPLSYISLHFSCCLEV